MAHLDWPRRSVPAISSQCKVVSSGGLKMRSSVLCARGRSVRLECQLFLRPRAEAEGRLKGQGLMFLGELTSQARDARCLRSSLTHQPSIECSLPFLRHDLSHLLKLGWPGVWD